MPSRRHAPISLCAMAMMLPIAAAQAGCAGRGDAGGGGGGSAGDGCTTLGEPAGDSNSNSDGDGGPAGNGNTRAGAGNVLAPPTQVTETVHAIGRVVTDGNGMTFAWSGTTLLSSFTGTGISVALRELTSPIQWPGGPSDGNGHVTPQGNRYAVTIDGTSQMLKPMVGAGTYPVATGLAAGSHTIKLTKLTEARVGAVTFGGFTVTGGQLTPTSRTVSRRLAVIGDSISAGYGNLGTTGAACHFSPDSEDGSQTYGMLAGAALGADVHLTAYSGKGVFRNNGPSQDAAGAQTMSTLWSLALPDAPQASWDTKAWTADAVVINLGTNDFADAWGSAPPQASFVGAYQSLVSQVRQAYPLAVILLAVGPMLYDNNSTIPNERATAISYVQAVIAALKDTQVHFLELTLADDSFLQGCDNHPNAAGQAAMAGQLQAALHQYLGW